MSISHRDHLPECFETFECAWEAPSNIAIVKYWGKSGVQLPANPNFSFTLKECVTKTKVRFIRRREDCSWCEVFLEGLPKESFRPKIETFLERAAHHYPWLKKTQLMIETSNTFPHGAGMASSASGMAALALCLSTFQRELFRERNENFYQQASFLARLGSGSACRSIFPQAVTWGVKSEEYASPFEGLHPSFCGMRDTILIVDDREKLISSRVGHTKMDSHPFKEARYRQARKNWKQLESILRAGDFFQFAEICEEEALSLHAMMMTSRPGYMLFRPQSLLIMQKVQEWRNQGHPLCYTLDAGPNVHLLFPSSHKESITSLIESELVPLLPTNRWIEDQMGSGPRPWDSSLAG